MTIEISEKLSTPGKPVLRRGHGHPSKSQLPSKDPEEILIDLKISPTTNGANYDGGFDIFYISLLFILVCFLSQGSLARVPPGLPKIKTTIYEEVGEIISTENIENLGYLLRNHDVNATISLPLSDALNRGDLSKVEHLRSLLSREGISDEFYEIIFTNRLISGAAITVLESTTKDAVVIEAKES